MKELRLYKVTNKYINYLHKADSKVQFNKDARRPYVGVAFEFHGYKYFVPMESPKDNHKNMKNGKHFMRISNGDYGILGFNNMIPVHKDALIEFDINNEPDEKYKTLLQHQIYAINRKKADIFSHAHDTYFDVVTGKNSFLIGISCDFRKLESLCKKYDINHIARKKSKMEHQK